MKLHFSQSKMNTLGMYKSGCTKPDLTFYHQKEGRGLTSSTSPYQAETNYINDKCRPRSSGNVDFVALVIL